MPQGFFKNYNHEYSICGNNDVNSLFVAHSKYIYAFNDNNLNVAVLVCYGQKPNQMAQLIIINYSYCKDTENSNISKHNCEKNIKLKLPESTSSERRKFCLCSELKYVRPFI